MSEPKWTPGPWKIERWSGFDYGSYQYSIPGIATNIGNKANANLIAAAPDLYAATDIPGINGIEFSDTMKDDSKMELHLTLGQFRALQAARRKARGEQ